MPSEAPENKRPAVLHVPSPEELARVFKKRKTNYEEHLDKKEELTTVLNLPPADQALDAPVRHLVPSKIVPVVHPPLKALDFFADLPEETDQERVQQVASVVERFPPPAPRVFKDESPHADSGILVPFIFPPLPVLHPDPYLIDPEIDDGNKPTELLRSLSDDSRPLGMPNKPIYPIIYPLPFPPPNYMPYPLVSEKAPLTPEQVFEDWIEALQNLPRVDMVVASAAGSIFDLRSHADSCGLTVSKLDLWVKQHRAESDPEADDVVSEDELSELDSGFNEYVNYANQIDKSNAYDKYADDSANNVVVNSDTWNRYANGELTESFLKEHRAKDVNFADVIPKEWSHEDIRHLGSVSMPELVYNGPQKISEITAKERRRDELLLTYNEMEAFSKQKKEQIYASKKLQLLEKLKRLQNTKVYFDDERTETTDEQMNDFILQRREQRDLELLRLKRYHSYEKLKAALIFYQLSNKIYKGLNFLLTNKLEKLKNFFEYQQQIVDDSQKPDYDGDLFNIRSKESAKLYESFVDHDFSNDIKQVFRIATANEEAGLESTHNLDFDASGFSKVLTDQQHAANVHDMMPLITEAEFRMITGHAPSKTSQKDSFNKNKPTARHHIFLNSVYERGATSGSDTNASDSGSTTAKRRPGRRAAPKPALGEDPSQERGEAALVAKIMKQFVGPAAATPNELTEDLDQMKLQTRWPVK